MDDDTPKQYLGLFYNKFLTLTRININIKLITNTYEYVNKFFFLIKFSLSAWIMCNIFDLQTIPFIVTCFKSLSGCYHEMKLRIVFKLHLAHEQIQFNLW